MTTLLRVAMLCAFAAFSAGCAKKKSSDKAMDKKSVHHKMTDKKKHKKADKKHMKAGYKKCKPCEKKRYSK